MTGRQPTPRLMLAVFAALLMLLVLTAVAASLPLGIFKMPVALLIAFAKAALIFIYFMQLRYQGGLVRVFAVSGFFWLAIIGTLTFADYLSRGWMF